MTDKLFAVLDICKLLWDSLSLSIGREQQISAINNDNSNTTTNNNNNSRINKSQCKFIESTQHTAGIQRRL